MLRWMLMVLMGLHAMAVHADSYDHSQWDNLLKAHVRVLDGGKVTQVDYRGMTRDRAGLGEYLADLQAVRREQFDRWPEHEQLAFLINTYNAWTVELVLSAYPAIDSIKDIGSLFRSPWQKAFIPLLGGIHSLDDIEHRMIRGSGRYHDPRVHFALNCASVGCPALRPEAYRGDNLDAQLDQAAALFLSDTRRNRLSGRKLEVSSIFKWYRADFEKGWRGIHTLEQFFARYADALGLSDHEIRRLTNDDMAIAYLDYDWRLNDVVDQNAEEDRRDESQS